MRNRSTNQCCETPQDQSSNMHAHSTRKQHPSFLNLPHDVFESIIEGFCVFDEQHTKSTFRITSNMASSRTRHTSPRGAPLKQHGDMTNVTVNSTTGGVCPQDLSLEGSLCQCRAGYRQGYVLYSREAHPLTSLYTFFPHPFRWLLLDFSQVFLLVHLLSSPPPRPPVLLAYHYKY